MRFVSSILRRVIYPALYRVGWLERIAPPRDCTVVTYHGLIPADHSPIEEFLDANLVHPERFRQQLRFLKSHYRIIDPEDFRAWIEQGKVLPDRAVLVTCDDGLVNTLTDMLPILQDEEIPCLFFVTGASCSRTPGMLWYEELYHLMRSGQPGDTDLVPANDGADSSNAKGFVSRWWNTVREASRLDSQTRADWMESLRSRCTLPQVLGSERRWRLLNLTELTKLADAGMSIGAHTLSHPVLTECSEQEARREIIESKTIIGSALGRPVWAFAYPFGNSSTVGDKDVRFAQEAGFTCAFLNVDNGGTKRSDPFVLSRIHITLAMGLPEFAAHLSGFHIRLQRLFRG
jgi:peptidoglycan/xylan/chitin deacetylase (PgdA/CDA1 family)